MRRQIVKRTSVVLLFQLAAAAMALCIIPSNIRHFGSEVWGGYQYYYVLVLGGFNWIGGVPYAFNRRYAIEYLESGFQILYGAYILSAAYSVVIALVIWQLFSFLDLGQGSFWEIVTCVIVANLAVINRNALEVHGLFALSSGLKFIAHVGIVLLPWLFGDISSRYIFGPLGVVIGVQACVLWGGLKGTSRFGIWKRMKSMGLEGLTAFKYSGVNQFYLMVVPALVKGSFGGLVFGWFMPVFELTSKSGIIGNAINAVISPAVSQKTIALKALNIFDYRRTAIVAVVVLLGGLLSSPAVLTFYLQRPFTWTVVIVYSLFLVAFVVMSIVSLHVRMLIAEGSIRVIILGSILSYIAALVMMVFVKSIIPIALLFLARGILEFVFIKGRVRAIT